MKFLELARNKAFWLLDNANGGKVKAYLKELQRIEGEPGITDNELKQYQQEQLKKLLLHAKNTVRIFADQDSLNINDWPVTNKMTYRENYDSCISSMYNKSALISMATSGSTGTPFISYQDDIKKKHVNAETLFYNGKIGYKVGRRIIYLRSIVSEVQKTIIQQFSQNIFLIDCNNLSDANIKNIMKQIVQLSRGCGAMIMGYASTFEAFHQYFEKNGYKEVEESKIYGIVSGSEMLFDQTRESMEKAFKCKCVSRYANEENGFLGQDNKINNVFYFNRAHYYFEILKMDEDLPVDEGEVGRIILTDLYNYAMPMIRYDTGDVGAFIKKDGRDVIGSFGGRRVDIVTNSHGEIVSPFAITNMMWKYQTVKQYQFVQKKAGIYILKTNPKQSKAIQNNLISDCKKVFGTEAVIEIKACDEIPVLASGKRSYIVNEMNK